VKRFSRVPRTGTKQAKAVSLEQWHRMSLFLDSTNMYVVWVAVFWVAVLQAAIRAVHGQRAKLVSLQDSHFELSIARGKAREGVERPPFQVAVPRYTPWGQDLGGRLAKLLDDNFSGVDFDEAVVHPARLRPSDA